MREYIEKVNYKVLYYISIFGIILTVVFFIFSLFNDINYRAILSLPLGFFIYLLCVAEDVTIKGTEHIVTIIFGLSFVILSFIDFGYDNYYDANDWKSCKGYIYDLDSRTTKHSPGVIYYQFRVKNKKIESEKPISIMVNFGFRKSDSIYVVYSESNPLINDIYSLESGPNLHDRENFVLYFIKNNSLFKWFALFVSISLIVKYLNNRNNDRYPL